MNRLKERLPHGGSHIPGKGTNRAAIKGQMSGLIGKAKASDHPSDPPVSQARPLAALRDPSSFGPPPKRYHAGAAAPNPLLPDGSGDTAIVQRDASRAPDTDARQTRYAGSEEQRAPPPPVPFRIDTTGLSTDNLPKPPARHVGPMREVESDTPAKKPKPSLPPRLPPRQNSAASTDAASPASPSYTYPRSPQTSYLNQGALNRLGAAGVNVPGLGIQASSEPANPWRDEPISMVDNTAAAPKKAPDLNELQSRFARMSAASTPPESPAQGTSFADKQAALRTATSFRNDPSSVTLADAKSAASTANNFRERHGEQVATGCQGASGLNKKYGIANRMAGVGGPSFSREDVPSPPSSPGMSPAQGKRPPPIPPKKGLGGASASQPPPVPLASRPQM
ncbi:hypothetical protein MMC13_004102 [Lambiella insularis]|nr:hypothetical protein [Lambiella insularis]